MKQQADIVFFQETYLDKDLEYIANSQFKMYDIHYSHGTNKSRGVCTAISKRLPIENVELWKDDEGRWIWLNLTMEGTKIELLNIYAPNDIKEQRTFYKTTGMEIIQRHTYGQILCVGGDFNVSLSQGDRLNEVSHRGNIVDEIYRIATKNELVDLWRLYLPTGRQFTWSREKETVASRLDYWLVPSRIIPQIITCRIQEAVQSDHRAVIWQVKMPLLQVKGPGIWRLNDTFLKKINLKRRSVP